MEAKSSFQAIESGSYQELVEDVGPIPRGIYRVLDHDDDFLILEVGDHVTLSIHGNWREKVIAVSHNRGSLHCLSQAKFLDRYYELLEQHRQNPTDFSPDKPITMCFMDPSLVRDGH